MRDSDEIRVETPDGVLRVTTDRPERMNTIDNATLDGPPAAFERETIGQVVLLGSNDFINAAKAFTAKKTPVFSGT
jgi:enoyl-CoA hydratase/carnithine racemase